MAITKAHGAPLEPEDYRRLGAEMKGIVERLRFLRNFPRQLMDEDHPSVKALQVDLKTLEVMMPLVTTSMNRVGKALFVPTVKRRRRKK